ncbi:hypothetical protein SCHPADRAFT_961021 [Schizopora paradoxa]|uniref:Uncharacterized protein n=1 Tax=Schizopora paradoxa TaxID=27342 RepID=A0A0H2S3H9_9AGAM|nr:hypothetical protein SCHPADRAFT_961021 [Schizopora paradoxa]
MCCTCYSCCFWSFEPMLIKRVLGMKGSKSSVCRKPLLTKVTGKTGEGTAPAEAACSEPNSHLGPFRPRKGAMDATGPVHWLRYFPDRDPDVINDANGILAECEDNLYEWMDVINLDFDWDSGLGYEGAYIDSDCEVKSDDAVCDPIPSEDIQARIRRDQEATQVLLCHRELAVRERENATHARAQNTSYLDRDWGGSLCLAPTPLRLRSYDVLQCVLEPELKSSSASVPAIVDTIITFNGFHLLLPQVFAVFAKDAYQRIWPELRSKLAVRLRSIGIHRDEVLRALRTGRNGRQSFLLTEFHSLPSCTISILVACPYYVPRPSLSTPSRRIPRMPERREPKDDEAPGVGTMKL